MIVDVLKYFSCTIIWTDQNFSKLYKEGGKMISLITLLTAAASCKIEVLQLGQHSAVMSFVFWSIMSVKNVPSSVFLTHVLWTPSEADNIYRWFT